MNARTIIQSILLAISLTQLSWAQGGPYVVDYLWPKAWPNERIAYYNSTAAAEAAGETPYVSNTIELAQSMKDYYVFFDSAKQSGYARRKQIDNDSCRVWLEWNGMYYPSNAGYDCERDAIPFYQLDPTCFASLQGPYCDIPNGVTYVGQVNGFPWVAFGGLYRKMGVEFTSSQIDKILDRNEDNNDVLRSDLRAELVNAFENAFPEFEGQVPIDYEGNLLTSTAGYDNTAVVCHIIPRIAPEGNGAGRNAYSNAMVISKSMKNELVDSVTGIGKAMPSAGMLFYFEWLAEQNGAKSNAAAESKFTATYIRDPAVLVEFEVEYLSEDETRVAMVHAGMIRPTAPKSTRK